MARSLIAPLLSTLNVITTWPFMNRAASGTFQLRRICATKRRTRGGWAGGGAGSARRRGRRVGFDALGSVAARVREWIRRIQPPLRRARDAVLVGEFTAHRRLRCPLVEPRLHEHEPGRLREA